MARKAVQRARREKSPRRTPERAVDAAPGGVPTLIGTLVKAGKFQEAILAGESELRENTADSEVCLCLARAYWGLAMAESAARQVDALLKESPSVELIALRAEIALTREEADPLQWLKTLARLDPENELLARAPFSAAPPTGEGLEALLNRADWYLRRGNDAAAEVNLCRAEALPAGIARASMLRWGWNREKALREASLETAQKSAPAKSPERPKSHSDELIMWRSLQGLREPGAQKSVPEVSSASAPSDVAGGAAGAAAPGAQPAGGNESAAVAPVTDSQEVHEEITATTEIPEAPRADEQTITAPIPHITAVTADSPSTEAGLEDTEETAMAAGGISEENVSEVVGVDQAPALAAWLQDTAATSAIVDRPVRSGTDDRLEDDEDEEDPEEIVSGLFRAEDSVAPPPDSSAAESAAYPVARAGEAQEEDVASEEKHSHAISAAPVDVEEMIVEADADDDEDGDAELYLLPNGIGAISLGLPFSNRASFGNEDDEVVVIERGDRPQVLRGEVDTWFRGKQDASWRTGSSVSITPDPQIGGYGFDDEDEVATEVARWTPDGRLESVRRTMQLYGNESDLDEDQEIIVPSQTTLPPGTRVPGLEKGSSGRGTQILNAIEEAAASAARESASQLSESTDAAAYARRNLLETRLADSSGDPEPVEITGKLGHEPENTDTASGRTAVSSAPRAGGREEVTNRLGRSGADEITNDLKRGKPDEATHNLGRGLPGEVTHDLGRRGPDEKTRDLGRGLSPVAPTDPGGALQEKTAESVRPASARPMAETRILPGDSMARHDDDLGLDLEEVVSNISPIAVKPREAEGPVARLSPNPAAPLEPSAARPPSAPPVPELPSLRTTSPVAASHAVPHADAEPGVAVPAPRISSPLLQQPVPFSRLRTTAPVLQKQTAQPRPAPRADGQYFRRPEKMASDTRWIYAVAFVLAVVAAIGFKVQLSSRHSQELDGVRNELTGALSHGNHAALSAALTRLQASELRSETALADLGVEMTWILWAEEGMKIGESEPDPKVLDAVSVSSSVPLIAARAERDLWRHDYATGRSFLEQALAQHAEEPVLLDLMGRLELALAGNDSKGLEAADARFHAALDAMQKARPDASPTSKARIQYDIARVLELSGKPSTDAYQAVLAAEPAFDWAALRKDIVAVPANAPLDTADASLRAILDQGKDKLSPRQRGAVYLERSRRALAAPNVEKALDLLADGERADGNDAEMLFVLGQLRNDLGQGAQAERLLTNAYRIAPTDLRIVNALVMALLSSNQGTAAVQIVNRVPAAFQGEPLARIVKSRLQRQANQLTGAEAQLKAAEEARPDLFEAKLEHAMLKMAQKSPDAGTTFEKLVPLAVTTRRPGLVPVLKAYEASLASEKSWAREMRSAEGQAAGNARALMILGESTYDHGDPGPAEKLLVAAQKVGDLPRIELLIARIAAKDPKRKDEALQIARRIQGACGEGPTCDEASHLVETLQQTGTPQ